MKHLFERATELIKGFKGQEVLVIGDVMLDTYQYAEVERISPEAPVPVAKIVEEEHRLGGAANVANNIRELGGSVFLIGSCGEDSSGERLKALLKERGINFKLFKKSITTTKTRIISQGQHLLRIDREDTEEEEIDFEEVKSIIKSFETIIVSDYAKGFITKKLLDVILDFDDKKVLIDPKFRNFSVYKRPFVITPNKKEASLWWGKKIRSEKDLISAGRFILDLTGSTNLIITLGKDGMAVFSEDGSVWKISAFVHNVFDVTGAGDVVISILGISLTCGADILEASFLANIGAGISVGKLGTSVVSCDELLKHLKNCPYDFKIQKLKE